MHRCALTALVLVMIPKLASGDPTTLDVFTSFELGDLGPTFGASPVSTIFVGGASVFEAAPSLYHNGSRSWRIDAGTITTINFETPASIVEFFALDVGTTDAAVTAFSPDGTPIGSSINLTNSFPGPMNDFSNPFSFNGLGPIGRLEVNNQGGGAAYVDSFGFNAVPELTADFDEDGDVDGTDFLAWQLNDGSEAGLTIWQESFGTATPLTATSTGVPEPATGLLLMLGMAALLTGYNRL